MTRKEFVDFCRHRHDIEVNQLYDGVRYSKHLEFVVAHCYRFGYLISNSWTDRGGFTLREYAELGCWGHDLLEDTRLTYNDLVEKVDTFLADIIFGCTESTGKNREERHDEAYYQRCSGNRLSVFVKLCDIMANVTYSILTKSSMYEKHKTEHKKTMMYLYREEFRPMYEYLDKLFALWK